jgi:hypothetical protein
MGKNNQRKDYHLSCPYCSYTAPGGGGRAARGMACGFNVPTLL